MILCSAHVVGDVTHTCIELLVTDTIDVFCFVSAESQDLSMNDWLRSYQRQNSPHDLNIDDNNAEEDENFGLDSDESDSEEQCKCCMYVCEKMCLCGR